MEIKLVKVVAGVYKVMIDGEYVGRVNKTSKGLWEARQMDGRSIAGYNTTRKDAVECVVAWYEAKLEEAKATEVEAEVEATEVPAVEVIEKKKPITIGDTVVCMWGSNKGKQFVVKALLDNGNFSLKIADASDDKYYEYHERHLEKVIVNPSTDVDTDVSTKVDTNAKTDTKVAGDVNLKLITKFNGRKVYLGMEGSYGAIPVYYGKKQHIADVWMDIEKDLGSDEITIKYYCTGIDDEKSGEYFSTPKEAIRSFLKRYLDDLDFHNGLVLQKQNRSVK